MTPPAGGRRDPMRTQRPPGQALPRRSRRRRPGPVRDPERRRLAAVAPHRHRLHGRYLVNEYGRQSLFQLPAYGGANCAVRTSSLRAVGGWNPRSVTEDTDLTLRLLRRFTYAVSPQHGPRLSVAPAVIWPIWPSRARQLCLCPESGRTRRPQGSCSPSSSPWAWPGAVAAARSIRRRPPRPRPPRRRPRAGRASRPRRRAGLPPRLRTSPSRPRRRPLSPGRRPVPRRTRRGP
jgi:hypothetical protein